MAHIVLAPFGSSGDLNPFIAVGLRLRERGHAVHFAVQEHFVPTVAEQGFTVHQLSGNVVAALAPYTRQLLGASNPIASLTILVRHGILPTLATHIDELRATCNQMDLLVTSTGQLAGSFVADLTGIPWATIALSPVTVPSAAIVTQPQPFTLPPPAQRLANRLQWGLGSLVIRQIADRPLNEVRRQYQLAPLHESLWLGGSSPRYVAVACSPAFQPPPTDWPRHVHMTGFCFWDTPTHWHAPDDLTTFLADPRPFVVVTAGSIGPDLLSAFMPFFQVSVAAVAATGARALVVGPPRGTTFPDADALTLPFMPYSQAFSGAAAVIHHGGIGTTAQALRYGVPALIVPWGVDQYYSAAQLTRSGAGKTLLWRRYNPSNATAALQALLRDPSYRQRAQHIQRDITQEDGVMTLCDGLTQLVE